MSINIKLRPTLTISWNIEKSHKPTHIWLIKFCISHPNDMHGDTHITNNEHVELGVYQTKIEFTRKNQNYRFVV
jgi:hypothetical protein